MFTKGEDLPLFSGTPMRAVAEVFHPQEQGVQLRLPQMPAFEFSDPLRKKKVPEQSGIFVASD